MFNKKQILQIRTNIQNVVNVPQTEEATKQRLILPLLAALEFDPYSSDIEPEYTLDFGIKKGEKVDYALQINNQPVAIVECKQLDHQLNKDNVQQLYRYFQVQGVHIAILTNGDDYWFFTDSVKSNIMDSEPYFKIKLTTATDAEIDKLEQYTKSNIQSLSIAELLQKEAFIREQKSLMQGLRNNNIPTWLILALWDRTKRNPDELEDKQNYNIQVDKQVLAGILYDEVQRTFKIPKQTNNFQSGLVDNDVIYDFDDVDDGDKLLTRQEKLKNNKENRQNIRLNHEYTYNDYSDGDWSFHKLDYAIAFGTKYDGVQFGGLIEIVTNYLIKCGYEDKLMSKALYGNPLQYKKDTGHVKPVKGSKLFLRTAYSAKDCVRVIESMMKVAGMDDENIRVQFIY